jgi:hypothetical protein
MSAAQATLPPPSTALLRQPGIFQSSAYIGIAAILAVFIVAFATAPKARAQDNGHHLHHADHCSKGQQPGTNASCCNGKETKDGHTSGDCYPTTAEVRAGSWWAKRDDGQACRLTACVMSVSTAVANEAEQQPSSPALMARCSQLYDLWWRYDEDPVFFGLAEKSHAELALYDCQQGRYAEGIEVLKQLLRRGGFDIP